VVIHSVIVTPASSPQRRARAHSTVEEDHLIKLLILDPLVEIAPNQAPKH